MKKTVLYLIIIVAALTGCTESEKTFRIGVSQCAGGQWRDKVNSEMLAAQHLFEQNVKVTVVNAQDDTERQICEIDSLSDAGIDLLVVAPNESAPIADAIARTRQRGIPVIFFDRKAMTDDYTAFIGGDNVEAGRTVGNYALSLAKLQAQAGHRPLVVEITGSMGTSPAQERHQGFAEAMQQQDWLDYQPLFSDWSATEAHKKVAQLLAENRVPDVVFCHNDAMCTGAFEVVKGTPYEQKVRLLGIDGMPEEGIAYVQKGWLAGTYIYPTHGERVVRLALDILTGQPYEQENPMEGMMVTPDNADIIALNSRELMHQNHDLVTVQDKLEDYLGLYNTQHKVLIGSLLSILLLLIGVLLTWRAARQQRRVHEQMKRLSEEQTLFYTNASHQLKTPLTLIAGPVRKLLEDGKLKSEEQGLLEIVGRNVAQLETLISSVLSFRKEMGSTVSDETAAEAVRQGAPADAIQESRLALLKQEDTDELPSILVVDDNDDMRRYLRTLLADKFYVLEAADGQGGLKLARDIVPDIVVSDVMMPVMNGLQLCKRLKEDAVTSHIPVLLLTARSSEAQQMEGYEHGADAYLTKPFRADLLISRIYNLVRSRQQLRHLFEASDTMTQPEASAIDESRELVDRPRPSSQDKLFADSLKEAILKNMSNPNLKMDELGDELGLSRVQLYRKVKALTGLSPVELLREMRLQRARTLLTTSTKTVAEVAYEVGFGTPSYFSKCFKQLFGEYPTDLRAE